MMKSVGIRSDVDTPGGVKHDKVFVPHYETCTQRSPGHATKPPISPLTLWNRSDLCSAFGVRGSSRSGLPASPSHAGLQAVLQGHAPTLPPWPVVSANGSTSASVVSSAVLSQHGQQQFQQSWSGLYRKLSDYQVALRASEKAREDGEKEMQALRTYVSHVETAAASLVSRVQDQENLLTLSTAFQQGHDAEQLRGKIATEAMQEAQRQATAAAESIAVAREATMELDKVERETNAWAMAQEAEIERLNMEAADCRMIYESSSKLIQDFHTQISNLQRQLVHQNAKIEDSQKTLQIEAGSFQKKYQDAKFAVNEKADQCDELMQALELSTVVGKAAELKLEELLAEKKKLIQKNDMLEQQVKQLKSQDGTAVVPYDQELRRVRNALGDEKAQLLGDLAQLRRSNQNLTEELKVDWHEKLRSSTSMNMSSSDQLQQLHTLPLQTSDALLIANASKLGVLCAKVDSHIRNRSPSKGCSHIHEEGEEGRLSAASSGSVSGSWHTETSGTKECNHRAAADVNTWSFSSSDCSSKEAQQQSRCETNVICRKFPDARSQLLSPGAASEGSGDDDTNASVLALQELTLLAAAQHEILKLKEINEQLVAACH